MKKLNVIIVYLISLVYMEFLYKLLIFDKFFDLAIFNLLVFVILFSILCGVITTLFKNEKANKWILISILGVIAIWFSAQYVVKDYFDFYISLSTFQVADQVGGFLGKTIIEIIKRIPCILLFFVPMITSIVFNKYINLEQKNKEKVIGFLGLTLLIYGVFLLCLNINKDKTYSVYNLYYNVNEVSLNMEKFGVINTFFIDVKRAVFGFEEKINLIQLDDETKKDNNKQEIKYDYNNLNINFDELISNETNKTIKDMHEYFKNDSGTLKNKYTGMFKGKNLILFMAESFNEIAINEKLTPTLYKLVNGGFSFENFYTPTIYSTIGGEFQELTGLYAYSTSILKQFRSGKIYFPQGIANKFNDLNYSTYAYHNNWHTFQDRNKYLESIGFDNFKGCGNGLEKLINCKEWPQSDIAMIKNTINDYSDKENFMVFYATVSGHASYNWGNAASRRHKDEYLSAGLDYSTKPASYLAAQMELDQALEYLITELDKKGILEDTVIALVGDHYPYELTIDEINEISTYKRDDVVTVNKSSFILWNSEMETVKVSKVGSQLDVIPTIYNVFGIDYDSRLFIGKDILSDGEGLAMFGNRSWVTDKGTYFTRSGKFVPVDGSVYDEDYVNAINNIVNNKITMSRLIIENNYYKKVLK